MFVYKSIIMKEKSFIKKWFMSSACKLLAGIHVPK